MRQETDPRRRAIVFAAFAAAFAFAAGEAAAQAGSPEALGFTKHFAVEITNPSTLLLENQAVILNVAEIRTAVAADFNTYMYALFDATGGEYALVVSQADDLDKDRYHDEIVFVRTLPPSSTTRLLCYYAPNRSFQLMPTPKAFARGRWQAGGAEAGWESNLAAYKFIDGRIGFYGKLRPELILKRFPFAETRPRDWGMDVLDPGVSAGLGGLFLWDGAKRIPLFGPEAAKADLAVISPGPVRGLVRATYPAVKTSRGDVTLTVFFSAFADNDYSRQDIAIASGSEAPVVLGPGIQKLPDETWTFDRARGSLAVWGKGAGKAGDIGLAAIFAPADLSGIDDAGLDRGVKLNGRFDRNLTFWTAGAWGRGVTAPEVPDAKGWTRHVDDMAARLLVPVKVEFKAR